MGATYPEVQGRSNPPQSMTVDIEALTLLFSSREPDVGMTVAEIAEATNMAPGRIRNLIKQGVKGGVIEVGKRWVPKDWDGRGRNYTVYSMTDEGVEVME